MRHSRFGNLHRSWRLGIALCAWLGCAAGPVLALEAPGAPEARECPGLPAPCYPTVQLAAEAGFLGVVDHAIQLSKYGTEFSYSRDGGQDVLFPATRFSAEAALNGRERVIFLYQPLELRTRATLTRALVVDDTTFAAGTAMDFRYSFPFYRISYLYNFSEDPERELSLGVSLQIRDSTIEFASLDGRYLTRNANIGPVPLVKFRWRQPVAGKWWCGAEVDGVYAPVSYLNGSDEEIVGALLDGSLRWGIRLAEGNDVFLNARYLGGGAVGTNKGHGGPGDGYVKNWLQFVIVSLGFSTTLF